MTRKNINRLIGYGILIFVIGYAGGLALTRYLQLLMPVGSILTFTGTIYFFKTTDLSEEFRHDPEDDILTYFWNALVLKLWTGIFILWMIAMDIVLPTKGFLLTGSN